MPSSEQKRSVNKRIAQFFQESFGGFSLLCYLCTEINLKKMISFECDYNNGAHPKVLQHLLETNDEQTLTYGFDKYSEQAREKIRAACMAPEVDIYFLAGGTQTNATAIDGMLLSHEAVITADSGHINVHEATAIEASGHKVIGLPSYEGKLHVEDLRHFMEVFTHDESRDHMAQPGMLYLTFPTEYGTLYSAKELEEIYDTCRHYGLKLFIDGARMGYGLMAHGNDVDLPYLSHHCDAFYIGGTKVGALCGEALVFPRNNAPKAFFSIVKRHGALMAKGRVIGLQFDALFTDYLYFNIARHAIDMAMKMKKMLTEKGYRLYLDSPTNQQFVVINNNKVRALEQQVVFTHWEPYDEDHTVCRFVTSWATTEAQLEILSGIL